MVDEINTRNTWRQITSPPKVKRVKQRPDYNRDQRFNQNGRQGGHGKAKAPGEPDKPDLSGDHDPADHEKKTAEDLDNELDNETKDRTGSAQGKLIDIVV